MLTLCPDCHRHARDEIACPFCGSLAPRSAPRPNAVLGRAGRAAIFLAGAVSLAACGNTNAAYGGPAPRPEPVSQDRGSGAETQQQPQPGPQQQPDLGTTVPAYGTPAPSQ